MATSNKSAAGTPKTTAAAAKPAANESSIPSAALPKATAATAPESLTPEQLPTQQPAGAQESKPITGTTTGAVKDTPAGNQETEQEYAQRLNTRQAPPVEDKRVRVTQGYMQALANVLSLGLPIPAAETTEDELVQIHADELAKRDATAKELQEQQNLQIELSKTKKSEMENKEYIMLVRETPNGKETKRFTRVAWAQMRGTRDGWREHVEEPAEVKSLKGGK